jgi:hypothetical protein
LYPAWFYIGFYFSNDAFKASIYRFFKMKEWERYEAAAREILKQLREHFSLDDVQGKQVVQGASGTVWEFDAVGISNPSKRLVLIECRLTKARQSQDKIAALSFTIQDTKAERGIIVTSKPLQKGAELVASYSGIMHFHLDSRSTSSDFLAQALGKLFIGLPSIGDTSQFGTPGIRHG